MVEMTALSSKSGTAVQHFKVFMFHTVVQWGFQEAAKNVYICSVDNSLLFPRVKEFQNRLTVDEVIAKIRHHVIYW